MVPERNAQSTFYLDRALLLILFLKRTNKEPKEGLVLKKNFISKTPFKIKKNLRLKIFRNSGSGFLSGLYIFPECLDFLNLRNQNSILSVRSCRQIESRNMGDFNFRGVIPNVHSCCPKE